MVFTVFFLMVLCCFYWVFDFLMVLCGFYCFFLMVLCCFYWVFDFFKWFYVVFTVFFFFNGFMLFLRGF